VVGPAVRRYRIPWRDRGGAPPGPRAGISHRGRRGDLARRRATAPDPTAPVAPGPLQRSSRFNARTHGSLSVGPARVGPTGRTTPAIDDPLDAARHLRAGEGLRLGPRASDPADRVIAAGLSPRSRDDYPITPLLNAA